MSIRDDLLDAKSELNSVKRESEKQIKRYKDSKKEIEELKLEKKYMLKLFASAIATMAIFWFLSILLVVYNI